MRHLIGFLRRRRHTDLAPPADVRAAEIPAPQTVERVSARDRANARQVEADLLQIEAEAQYQRDRFALYNARVVTGRPASATRLEELRRLAAAADARLTRARAAIDVRRRRDAR